MITIPFSGSEYLISTLKKTISFESAVYDSCFAMGQLMVFGWNMTWQQHI